MTRTDTMHTNALHPPLAPQAGSRSARMRAPFRRLLAGAVLAACLPAAHAQLDADNVLPATIDAAIGSPDDHAEYGVPDHAPAKVIASDTDTASARSVVAVGDVTGDGAEDFAVGFAPGSGPSTLQVRDGRTGAPVWSATPDDGGFRGLRTIAFVDGSLVIAASSRNGRVQRLQPATGTPVWTADLATPARFAPRARPANLLALEPLVDVNGDGATDLLVAGGRGLNAVVLLSGADGAVLWTHAAADAVNDVRRTGDIDADGVPDVLACGGDLVPFARLLSGATGAVLWSVGVAGTGAAIHPLPDINDDGLPDVAVGVLASPAPCLYALSGSDGAPLWTSEYAVHGVTGILPLPDIDGDGLDEIVITGFDNALAAVLSKSGLYQWRTECSTTNGGSMLFAAVLGDVNGNGSLDLVTSSFDRHVYLLDGIKGHYLSVHDLRARGVAMAVLKDADGDGRREFVAAGDGRLLVLSGASGTAEGPVCYLNAPTALSSETVVFSYAYPGVPLIVLGSTAAGHLTLPGFQGVFGLSPTLFQVVHAGIAPGAGISGYVVEPLPREFIGLTIRFQTVTLFAPGRGAFSNVASYVVPP